MLLIVDVIWKHKVRGLRAPRGWHPLRKTVEFQFILGSPVLSLYVFGLSWGVQATLVHDRQEGKKIENRGEEMKDKRVPSEHTQGKLKVWNINHRPPLFVHNWVLIHLGIQLDSQKAILKYVFVFVCHSAPRMTHRLWEVSLACCRD